MADQIGIAIPKAGAIYFSAEVVRDGKIRFSFSFPITANAATIKEACLAQVRARKVSTTLGDADYLRAYNNAQANQPAAPIIREIPLDEQRRKLVWAVQDAEHLLMEDRERAYQRDMGSIPAGSRVLADARAALTAFDAAHPEAQPALSSEAMWNL